MKTDASVSAGRLVEINELHQIIFTLEARIAELAETLAECRALVTECLAIKKDSANVR